MLIALSMSVGLLQINIAAAETEEAGAQSQPVLQDNSDMSIEGSDSVGMLLSDAFSEAEEKSSKMEEQGAYVSDLVISGNQAVATYYTEKDADVVVAIYDEETKQMLASGKASVPKGEETQTVTVPIEGNMPQYFNASAFILDSKSHEPLCEAYSTNLYNRAMQELENSTVADYNPEQVLNLDENEATNFVVYGEGTKIIDYSTDVNQVTDNGNGRYTITNADSDFTSLQEGDIFSYSNEDGSVLIAKVKSIAIDGTTVTVTEDADIELDNVFDYVKVEGGVKNPMQQEAELHTESRAATLEGSASVTASVDKKIEGGNPLDGSKKGSFSIKGSLKIDGYVKAYISLKSQYIEAKVSISLSGEVELKGSIKAKELELMPTAPYLTICPRVFMQIKPVFVAEFAASLKTSVTISAAAGIKYDSGSGAKNTSERPALQGEFKAEGTLFIGFKPVAEVFIISDKVGGASVSAQAGLKLALSYTKEASTGATSKHQCKNCLSRKLSAEFKIDAEIEVVNKVVFKANIVKLSFPNILECYYSKDYNEFAWKACPHKAYKITAKAKDEKGKAVDGVTISGQGVDLKAVTDASGMAAFFLPDGTYNLVFTKGKNNVTLQLVVEGKAKEVAVTMKIGDVKIIASGKYEGQFWEVDENGLLVVSMEGSSSDNRSWRYYRDSIKAVIIENGIVSIGSKAFYYYTGLTSITLPAGLTSIGKTAFYGCTGLTSITLPAGLTSIGEGAFKGCTGLTSITLPAGLTSIGEDAFKGCEKLSDIYYEGNETSWMAIDIGGQGNSALRSATKHFNYEYSSEDKSVSSMHLYSVSGSLDDSTIGFSGTIYLKDGMKASNEEWASIVNGIKWSVSDTSIVDNITCQWPEVLGETSSLSLILGVTPKSAGTVTITGTFPDGIQVTCTVTVNAANAVNAAAVDVPALVDAAVDNIPVMDAADTVNADELQTPAIIDRFHYYLPGWEMEKMKTENYSSDYGFISDYFSKILHDFRKRGYADIMDQYFILDSSLSGRDTKAIKKTMSGLLKLLHPDLNVTKEEIQEYLEFAMEGRMRVKEQLKRRGGLEFFGANFRYVDKESQMAKQVFLKEMVNGAGSMIAPLDIGEVYTVITKEDRMFPVKIETNVITGGGTYQITGRPSAEAKETIKNVYNYVKSNSGNMGIANIIEENTFATELIDENASGGNTEIGSAFYLSMISVFLKKPLKSKTVILGSMTVNGNLIKTANLYEKLEYIAEQGAKTVYVPLINQPDAITMPGEIWNLKNFKPLDALCEYIWNGFDAQADRVDVKLHTNEFGLINMISIVDNGTGIAYEELGDKFKPFNDSKKYDSSKKVNHSLPHGRQGIGRLTFFAFAQRARWNTVYEKDGNKYEYYIDMEKDSLNQYDDNGGRTPKTTEKDVGTEVIFTQIQQFSKEDIVERIKTEFFGFWN